MVTGVQTCALPIFGLKNHPLPGINFVQLEQSGVPTQPPTRPPSHTEERLTEERPREAGSRILSSEQLATMFASASKGALKRAPTPHNDSSSEEEEEPEDKDPFGSFGI